MCKRKLLSFLIVLMATCGPTFAEEARNVSEMPSFGVKLTFGNPSALEWHPRWGGAFDVDFALLRYFSLGAELAVNYGAIKSALGEDNGKRPTSFTTTLALVPTLRVPIGIKSTMLIPYFATHVGTGFSIVHNVSSLNGLIAWRLGSKLFFDEHWGVSADYGFQLDFRNNNNAYVAISHMGGLGLVYSL